MDLLALISDTYDYTLHSHTQFCDGRADIDTMAAAAVALGMAVYGITPHSPIPFPSPCNMRREDVGPYFEAVERVRLRYPQCRFLRGMEIDYIDEDWGPHSPYFATLGLDFSIGSVHFIPDMEGEPVDIDGSFDNFKRKMADRFRGDIDYVVDTFYHQSMDMLAKGGFDILGHLDKVGQNASYFAPGIEEGSHYRSLVDEYLGRVIASGVIVEINSKALYDHKRIFPGERYLPRLLDAGVPMVVNSDAHWPDRIDAGRREVLALLANLRKDRHGAPSQGH